MAVREFKIPFGPDRTGELGSPDLFADVKEGAEAPHPFAEPKHAADAVHTAAQDAVQPTSADRFVQDVGEAGVEDPFSHPPIGAFARETRNVKAGLPEDPDLDEIDGFGVEDQVVIASQDADLAAYDDGLDAVYAAGAEDDLDEGLLDEESGSGDVSKSFSAWKSSIGQSRELKTIRKKMSRLQDQIDAGREELDDREHILRNYEKLVSEQDTIIRECTAQRDRGKAELAHLVDETEAIEDELVRMREYHESQMQPLETELGRAKAMADQAKNDERSRKSELNSAESEMRRAGPSQDSTMASAKHQQTKDAYERARDASARAQEMLAEVQRAYDDAKNAVKQAEGPLERAIKDLEDQEAELKEIVADLGDQISLARKRRQYCDMVRRYPEETEKLRASIQMDEEDLADLEMDFDELDELLGQSKAKARKAKVAIILVAVIIIAIAIAIAVVLSRI